MKTREIIIAQIETEARRLARTGTHVDHRTIKRAFLDTGYMEAERLFRNRWIMQEIDRICLNARAAVPRPALTCQAPSLQFVEALDELLSEPDDDDQKPPASHSAVP